MSSSAVLPRSAGATALAVAIGLLLSGPGLASANLCGDDVNGRRVACACGDEVVSDTTLSAIDPVTAEPCSGDGLIISAPRGSAGITLNLSGLSIVGMGRGNGIRVIHGGSAGSSILGGSSESGAPGEIANFRIGISGSGRNVLNLVSGVYVHDNTSDGLRVHSSGVRIEDVVSERNGRDGVSVFGHAVEVGGVVAQGNHSDGVQVRGEGASVSAEATGNRRHGLIVAGSSNRVDDSKTSGNGGAGLVTSGSNVAVGNVEIGHNADGDVKDSANAVSEEAR